MLSTQNEEWWSLHLDAPGTDRRFGVHRRSRCIASQPQRFGRDARRRMFLLGRSVRKTKVKIAAALFLEAIVGVGRPIFRVLRVTPSVADDRVVAAVAEVGALGGIELAVALVEGGHLGGGVAQRFGVGGLLGDLDGGLELAHQEDEALAA